MNNVEEHEHEHEHEQRQEIETRMESVETTTTVIQQTHQQIQAGQWCQQQAPEKTGGTTTSSATTPQTGGTSTRSEHLSPIPGKVGWLTVLIFAGIVPGMITFPIWVTFEITPLLFMDPLTTFFINFVAPLTQFHGTYFKTVEFKVSWNISLFVLWFFVHVFLVQKTGVNLLKKMVPIQAVRATHILLSTFVSSLMIALWKPTGVVVWNLLEIVPGWMEASFGAGIWDPIRLRRSIAYSMAVLGGFCMVNIYLVVSELDLWYFLGMKQLWMSRVEVEQAETEWEKKLRMSRRFGVRHPISSLTLLSLAVSSPVMTLDRLLLMSTMLVVLVVALPLLERRMSENLGEQFAQFKRDVPYRLIPYIY